MPVIEPSANVLDSDKSSIAVRASDGTTFISFYDATSKELRIAVQVTPGSGNCGNNGRWHCTTVDSAGDEAWIVNDNTDVPTARISSSELRTTISASALVTAGEKQIQVCNPPFPLSDCSNVLSFTVTAKQDQTIAFATLPDRTLGDPPFTVSATASSALAVVFASTTPAVCTVNGNTVTLLTTGSCSVVASQPGNTVYSAAQPVIQTFQVQPAGQVNQQSLFLPVIQK
jgi:hypothetical protein